MIYEGTTPTHTFTIPFDITLISKLRILYSQNNEVLITKELGDCTVLDNAVEVKLTQQETLAFDPRYNVEIQLRVLTAGGDALSSDIITTTVNRCLESDVLA